jgi:hypothetical protein
MIVIWEVVGLKETPSELLAASTESYFRAQKRYSPLRPLYSEPKLPWVGGGVRRIGKIAESDH